MNKQQAIDCLKEWQKIAEAEDDCVLIHHENVALIIRALDDTHEGFSNRETWAAANYLKSNLLLSEKRDATSLKQYAEAVYDGYRKGHAFDYQLPLLLSVGSLWRVNWDEVARELRGGEG